MFAKNWKTANGRIQVIARATSYVVASAVSGANRNEKFAMLVRPSESDTKDASILNRIEI